MQYVEDIVQISAQFYIALKNEKNTQFKFMHNFTSTIAV